MGFIDALLAFVVSFLVCGAGCFSGLGDLVVKDLIAFSEVLNDMRDTSYEI